MQLQILGSGGSLGVPSVGCRCAVCTSTHPRNKRSRTSALITLDDGRGILIDASPDFRYQTTQLNVARIDAVLFTHPHADHILGTDDLRGYNFTQRSRICCYGDAHTLKELRRFFHYIFEPDPAYEGGGLARLDLQEVAPYSVFEVCGVKVEHFEIKHGSASISGFKIGSFAYATDCSGLPERTAALLSGIDILVLGALRFKPHRTHYTIPQAVEAAHALGAKKTYLVHTTHDVDYESASAGLPPDVELGYDGLTAEIRYDR